MSEIDIMPEKFIINARRHLRWHQRLATDASTAAMWGGWLYLWQPLFKAAAWLSAWGSRPLIGKLLAATPLVALQQPALTLVGACGALLLWSLLPARKVAAPEVVQSLADYAAHFGLPEQQIQAGQGTAVCVVHHDDQGRIIGIEARC